jgi:hypothetical protein
MIFCDEKKLCFIKSKKVAGTSIEIYLSPHVGASAIVTPVRPPEEPHKPRNFTLADGTELTNHMTAMDVRRLIGPARYDAVESFAVIRNPFERVLSYYFMKINRAYKHGDPTGPLITLDEAIENLDTEDKRLQLPDGSLAVTTLVNYSRLNDELGQLFARHGIPFSGSLGVYAKSQQKKKFGQTVPDFSPAQQRRVRERFAFEFGLARKNNWDWADATGPIKKAA